MTDNGPIRGVGTNLPHVNGDLDRLDRGLARLAEAGCGFAELYPPALDVVVGGRLNAERLRRVEAICGRHGALRYTVHAPIALNLMDEPNLERHMAVARATLDVCAAIGADVAVVHPGIVPRAVADAGLDYLLEVERRAFQELAPEAEARGVAVCIENLMPDRRVVAGERFIDALDPRRLAAQIEAIRRPNVHGTLDFSHAWLAAGHLGFDFAGAVRAFAPLVRHLHVHDSCGLPAAGLEAGDSDRIAYGEGDLHLPIGWGTVDFDAVLPGLPVRPGTTMIFEFHPRYWPELEACVRGTRACADLINGGPAAAAVAGDDRRGRAG